MKSRNQGYINKFNSAKNKTIARKKMEGKKLPEMLSLNGGHAGDFFFFLCRIFRKLLKVTLLLKMGEDDSMKTH